MSILYPQLTRLVPSDKLLWIARFGTALLALLFAGSMTVWAQCTVNPGPAMAAICQGGTSAVLGGSFSGLATGAIWSAPSGTFSANNDGSDPANVTFTAAANSPSPVILTLTAQGPCGLVTTAKNITVTANPVVAATAGIQSICRPGGTSQFTNATSGGVWSTANSSIATVSGTGLVTAGATPGTTNINYTRTVGACATTVSRAINVYSGAQGTPNTYGDGVWNAYVYSGTDYATGYSGYYTTPAALGFSSGTYYGNNIVPSAAPTYQGCQLATSEAYSIRFQRTNFPAGTYQFGVGRNNENVTIIIDGVQRFTRNTSTTVIGNVWTCTLGASSLVEIRHNNITATGEVAFTLGTVTNTPATPGTITGTANLCTGTGSGTTLGSSAAAVLGTCNVLGAGYQWQISTDGGSSYSNIAGATGTTYTLPGNLTATTSYRRQYNTACETVTSNVVTLTVLPRPVMTSATSATICSGSPTNLTLTSDVASTYAWTVTAQGNVTNEAAGSGTLLNGATALVNTTTVPQNVVYQVTPTSSTTPGCAATAAQTVTITVNPPNTITANPASVSSCAGGNVSFTANGIGLAPVSFQWTENNVPITNGGIFSGATTGTLTLTGVTAGMNGNQYRLVVSNSCPAATSNPATLTISPIANNTFTAAQAVCNGAAPAAIFTGSTPTGGVGGYTYLWERSTTDAVSGFTPIASSNVINYDVRFAHTQTTWYRRVVTTGGNCASTSPALAITVQPRPLMTSGTATTICSGTPTGFGLTADIASTFAWTVTAQADVTGEAAGTGTTLNGATNLVNTTTVPQNVVYQVTPTSTTTPACAASVAQTVTVTVNPPNIITANPAAASACVGGTATFTANGTGLSPTFTWTENGVPLTNGGVYSGVNTGTLTLTGVTAGMAGNQYRLVLSNGCASATSNPAALSITSIANNTATASQSVCTGQSPANAFTGSTPTGGVGAYTYLWESSTTNASSGFAPAAGTNNTINYGVNSFAHNQTTWYRRTVTTSGNCANTSTPLEITVYTTPPGDPSVFGNNTWNVYGYNNPSNMFGTLTTYAGYYTEPSLSFSTLTRWASASRPSNASGWQGCLMQTDNIGLSMKRTGFTPGYYQIDLPNHDDGVRIFKDGTMFYSLNACCAPRTNVFTGYLDATSQLEMQLFQGGGGSYLQATFTPVATPAPLVAGTISGTQSICSGQIPQIPLATVIDGSSGCSIAALGYQWQSSDDNVNFVDIVGANAATYTFSSTLTESTWFRRGLTDACGVTAYSNTVKVTLDNNTYGDPTDWGINTWNNYVYGTSTFTNYAGFYTESLASFSTTNRFASSTQSPSWASGYQGCQVTPSTFSVVMRRQGFPVLPSNQAYRIDLASIDETVNLLIDSASVFQRGCCVAVGSPQTNLWVGPLDANSNVELRWQQTGGGAHAGLTFTVIPKPTSINPGSITGSDTICSGDIPVAGFPSATLPSAGCHVDFYRWQISTDNGATWLTLPNSNTTSFTPVQSIYGIPGSQTWFRRQVWDVCGNSASTAPAIITIQNATPGNPAIFPANRWNVYAYDDPNYALYVGYYTENNLSFDTRQRHSQNLPPSAAPATGSGLAYQGCQQTNVQWSASAKRQGIGSNPAGYYQVNVQWHDDNLTFNVNGQQAFQHIGCCDAHSNIWTGYLDGTSELEFRWVNFPGPGGLAMTFTYLGVNPPGPIDPGTLDASVTQFCPGDAYFINSLTLASGGCTPLYQWQQWDGASWTDIVGQTSASLTSVNGLSGDASFRRAASDLCGNTTTYTDPVALTVATTTLPTLSSFVWTALLYNAPDFTSNFSGYYTENNLDINTSLRHSNTSPPSGANGLSGNAYIGCLTNSNNYSVRYVRTGFPTATYSIDIPAHDDGAYVYINNVLAWSHVGCCDSHTNVWTGNLGASDNVEIRYVNGPAGPGYLQAVFNVVTPTVPLGAGTIGADQTICFNAAPAAITQTVAPTGSCNVINYQWYSSTNNVTFTPIVGATASSYTSSALTATTYFRRQDIDGCGATAFTNTITVTVNPLVVAGTIGTNQSVCATVAAATLNQTAAPTGGNGAYAYQWQVSTDNITFNNIGGATTTSYNPGVVGTIRYYRLRYISCGGTVFSNVVTISINPATAITTQPANFTGCAGGTATFTVATTGIGLGYQWQVSTNSGGSYANVASGGNAATYNVTIPAVITPANSLRYRVIVTGTCATTSITSNQANLNLGAPTVTTQPATQSICAGGSVTFIAAGTGATGFQWQEDPATGTYANITGATTSSYSIPAVTVGQNNYRYRCVLTSACGSTNSNGGTLTVIPVITGNTISGDQPLCSGGVGTALTVGTVGGGTGAFTYAWESSTAGAGGPFTPLGVTTAGYTPIGFTVDTWLRRVVTSSACASTSGVVAITIAPTFSISTQPAASTVCPNTASSFSVATTGSPTTYQWQVNTGSGYTNLADDATYSGTTASTLSISSATLAMNGYLYRAVVTGVGFCATTSISSTGVALTTNILPAITVQPVNVTTCNATALNIPLTATGASLTYQWQRKAPGDPGFTNIINGTNYANATTTSLRLLNPSAAFNGYEFRCIVNNACTAPVTSNAVTFTFQSAIGGNSISSPQTVCSGATPVLLEGSTPTGGNGTYTYQWSENVNGGGWTVISGASGIDYQPGALTQTTQYRRLVSSSNCNTTNSIAITITVDLPPTVTAPPATVTTCANASTTIGVVTTGNNVSLQWQLSTNGGISFANVANGTRYSGVNSSTLTVIAPPPSFNNYQYRCVVTGDCGGVANSQVISAASTLMINNGATVTASPVDRAICVNQNTTFVANYTLPAPGTLPLTLVWQERIGAGSWNNLADGGVYSGVTTASLTLTNVPVSMSGRRYRLAIVYGGCLVTTSTTLGALTVNALPNVNPVASPATVCAGASSTLSVSGTTTYLWSTGQTTTSITVTPPSVGPNIYTVTGTNTATGCSRTVNVTVNVNPITPPAVSIATASTTICGNTATTFTATPTNGGVSPSYQWRVNGGNVGTNSPTFTTSALTDGQTVSCVLTSNATCATPTTATSNSLVMAVTPNVGLASTPSGPLSICQGSAPTDYTTTATNASAYIWSISGAGNTVTGTGTTVTVTWNAGFSGVATLSVQANGCAGPTAAATTTINVRAPGAWVGNTTDWNDGANWCGGVPTITTDVLIPTGAAVMPALTANAFARNLVLQTGTTLTLAGANNLTVAGTFTRNGTVVFGANSIFTYSAAGAQAIEPLDYVNLVTSGGAKTFTGTTRIGGNFTAGASSHTLTGSTLEFNGTVDQTIPGLAYNNLTTSGSSIKSMVGTTSVAGALTLTNGLFEIGANQLTLNGTIAGLGSLSGTCSSALQIGGAGSTGSLRFANGANTLGNLMMQKTAAGDVSLLGDLNICTGLTLTQGKVVIGANTLTLLPGAATTNGNATSYVQTLDQLSPTGAGFLVQQMPIGGGSRTFPVGNATTYTPAYLNNAGSTRNFKVRVFSNVYENGIAGALIQNIETSVKKTWEIEPLPGAGTPDVSINLQWNLADEGTAFAGVRANSALPYIGKNTGVGSSPWIQQVVSAGNYTAEPFTISTPSVTTFSKFAIGSQMTPLPVTMSDLSVVSDAKTNKLMWETYAEIASKGFHILRSADGKEFTNIGFVRGAGNSNNKRGYSFVDQATPRRIYYKLMFVGEAEGDVAYSNVVTVSPGSKASFRLYPNPASSILIVEGDNEEETDKATRFRLTDVTGKQVIISPSEYGSQGFALNVADLQPGIYQVEKIQNGQVVGTARVIKQ